MLSKYFLNSSKKIPLMMINLSFFDIFSGYSIVNSLHVAFSLSTCDNFINYCFLHTIYSLLIGWLNSSWHHTPHIYFISFCSHPKILFYSIFFLLKDFYAMIFSSLFFKHFYEESRMEYEIKILIQSVQWFLEDWLEVAMLRCLSWEKNLNSNVFLL
jgi:hypothetical protein